jgi:hypothetical protein
MDCEEKKDVKVEEAIFDLTEQYKEKIIPLAEQLMHACEEIGLPYLMHFVIRNNEELSSCGTIASAQEKKCLATATLMAAGHMVNGDEDVLPVPINAKKSSTMLALAAFAASLKNEE